ncbi:MAG: YHS domain-containing protein [Candidatus Rokubacteria bacterium]|nr:YHS domain-containing protein [Candidatus Rokubacteria bacterium]
MGMFFTLFAKAKTVKDPVCGMAVPKDGASTYQFVGETYYFCSERCRDRFQALPARFLEEAPIKLTDSSGSGAACC